MEAAPRHAHAMPGDDPRLPIPRQLLEAAQRDGRTAWLDALPESLSPALKQKILLDNPLATYPRLREAEPKEIRQ